MYAHSKYIASRLEYFRDIELDWQSTAARCAELNIVDPNFAPRLDAIEAKNILRLA